MRPTVLLALLLAAASAGGQERRPLALDEVGIDQRLNELVPLDLDFFDEAGRPVTLGTYCRDRPVILVLAYYRCPMLCNEVLNGLRDSVTSAAFKLRLGSDFDIVTVSFDPRERPELAAAKKASYVESAAGLGQPDVARGWHFLTGPRASIDRLTKAVGFRYTFDRNRDEFAHAGGLMVLTPEGRLSHYFYGIDFPPRFLRLALVQASRHEIGSPVDRVLLLCYHYDPATGQYTLAVMNLVRAGAVLTLLALGTFVGWMWRRDWLGQGPAARVSTPAASE